MCCHIFNWWYRCVLMDHLPHLQCICHNCTLLLLLFLKLCVRCVSLVSRFLWCLMTWPLSTNCGQRCPGQTPECVRGYMCVLREAGRWWVGAGWGHSYCLGCHGWATPEPLRGPKGPRRQATAMSPRAPRPWEPRSWSMSAGSLGTLGATGWAIWSREQRPWHTAVTRGRHAETWT